MPEQVKLYGETVGGEYSASLSMQMASSTSQANMERL